MTMLPADSKLEESEMRCGKAVDMGIIACKYPDSGGKPDLSQCATEQQAHSA